MVFSLKIGNVILNLLLKLLFVVDIFFLKWLIKKCNVCNCIIYLVEKKNFE